MAYFIHNKYDKASIDALAAIDQTANTVIDYYGEYETYKYLDTSAGFGKLYDTLSYVTPETVIHGGQSDKDNSHFNFQSSIVVKSIQSGTFTLSSKVKEVTISISIIDPTKSIVLLSGAYNPIYPYLKSITNNSIVVAHSGSSNEAICSYQVIEYC